MRYSINEGFLNLPEGCEDRSQNVIYLEAAGGDTPVLVLTRDELEAGESMEMYVTRQLKRMSRDIKNFKVLSQGPLENGPGGFPAYAYEARFGPANDPRYQVHVTVSHSGNKVLLFGLTTLREPGEKLRGQWEAILSSYTFSDPITVDA